MAKRTIILSITIVMLFALATPLLRSAGVAMRDYWRSDRCLDSGGSWDALTKACRIN